MRNARAKLRVGAAIVALLGAGSVVQHGAYGQAAPKLEDTVIYSMPGGTGLEVMKQCAADNFTKATNVRVEFLGLGGVQTIARVLLQRSSPTIDVMWGIEANEYTGLKEGVLLPLTPELIPNLANIDPKVGAAPNSAVVAISIQGIQYNTKVFKEKGLEPPKAWKDLWDPKYQGRIGLNDPSAGSGLALLAVAGLLNGGDTKNYDAAFQQIAKMKPNIYTVFTQAPQYDAALLDETVWLGIQNAARPLAMMQAGAPIAFVQPEEGVVISNSSISVVKGAPHPNAALAFANWMLSREAQICLIKAGYAPVVKGVEVPPELVPYMTVQRKVIPADARAFQDRLPETLRRWAKEIDAK